MQIRVSPSHEKKTDKTDICQPVSRSDAKASAPPVPSKMLLSVLWNAQPWTVLCSCAQPDFIELSRILNQAAELTLRLVQEQEQEEYKRCGFNSNFVVRFGAKVKKILAFLILISNIGPISAKKTNIGWYRITSKLSGVSKKMCLFCSSASARCK